MTSYKVNNKGFKMLCKKLVSAKNKIYSNRHKIFKKDRRLKNKTYKKRFRLISKYLDSRELLIIRLLLRKGNIDKRYNIKNILKFIFKFDCTNIYYREHYSKLKLVDKYKTLSDLSKFKHNPNNILDDIILTMIKKF